MSAEIIPMHRDDSGRLAIARNIGAYEPRERTITWGEALVTAICLGSIPLILIGAVLFATP